MKHKQIIQNISGGGIFYIVSLISGVFLTPLLVDRLGMVSYGLLSVGTTLLICLDLIRNAINSMVGRFMVIALKNNDSKSAEAYFNSALFATMLVTVPLLALFTIAIYFRGVLFNIPKHCESAFLLLLFFMAGTFLVKFLSAPFACAYFISNRIDLKGLVDTGSKSCYIALVFLFVYFRWIPNIASVGGAEFAGGMVMAVCGIVAWRRLLPGIQIRAHAFHFKTLKILVASGGWNSLNNINGFLFNAVDIYLANVFLPGNEGLIAITKAFPGYLYALILVIRNAFTPTIVQCYAEKNRPKTQKNIIELSNYLIFLGSIVLGEFFAFGQEFYHLWLPDANAQLLYWMTLGLFAPYAVSLGIQYYLGVYIAANRVKEPALFCFGLGLLKSICSIIFLSYTSWGVWVIVIFSAIFGFLRDYCLAIYYLSQILLISNSAVP